MHTKLTLRLNDALIQTAKAHAKEQHKSLSGLVADYFALLGQKQKIKNQALPPITASLKGALNKQAKAKVSELDYKKYLLEKYL